jgi:DNA-binding protein Fis
MKFRKKPVIVEAVQWKGNNQSVAAPTLPIARHLRAVLVEYAVLVRVRDRT